MYRFLPLYSSNAHVPRLSSFAVKWRSHIFHLPSSIVALASLFLLLSFLFSLFSVKSLYAATYYVDAMSGTDANDGLSQGTAWKTIAKVNTSRFVPGDSILFNKGDTWSEQLIVPSSGSSGGPITFGAYGTGANPIIDATGLLYGLVINTKSYITVTDLEIKNFTNIGVIDTSSSNTTVTKCYVHDGQGTGIGVSGTTNSTFTYNKIWNLAVSAGAGTYYNGIDVNNNSTGNVFYNNTIAKVYQGCVTFETGSNGNTAKNNILDSTGNGAAFPLSIYVDSSITSLTLGHNDYWFTTYLGNWKGTVETSFSAWVAATGETGSISANPVFVSTTTPDLHLQATSPCIDAGVNVGLTQDLADNPVPSIPDIGAYEYAPAAMTPPTGLRILS